MSRILIVEDQNKYKKAAEEYFSTRNIDPIYAQDYDQAIQALSDGVSGAMIDCFFPKSTGTGDILLGRKVVNIMRKSDVTEIYTEKVFKWAEEFVDTTDETIKKYLRIISRFHSSPGDNLSNLLQNPLQNPIFFIIESYGKMFSKDNSTQHFKVALERTFGDQYGVWSEDLYQILLEKIDESESNQPLGIAVAQSVSDLGIPLVLVTSTFHHDTLTQPIQDYVSDKQWKLIDCIPSEKNAKTHPIFWERAFGELEKKM
jgi:hypothetical protein